MCTILKSKEIIEVAYVAKGVTRLTSRRSNIIEETEKTPPSVDTCEAEVGWGYHLRKTYL